MNILREAVNVLDNDTLGLVLKEACVESTVFKVKDVSSHNNCAIDCEKCKNLTDITQINKCGKFHDMIGAIEIYNSTFCFMLPITCENIKDVMILKYYDKFIQMRIDDERSPCALWVNFSTTSIDCPHANMIIVTSEDEMINIRRGIMNIVRSWNIRFMQIEETLVVKKINDDLLEQQFYLISNTNFVCYVSSSLSPNTSTYSRGEIVGAVDKTSNTLKSDDFRRLTQDEYNLYLSKYSEMISISECAKPK